MHPQTAPFLNEPDFVAKISEIQQNPQNITKYLQDKRIMAVLGVLMGVQGADAEEAMQEDEPEEKPKPAPKEVPKETPKAAPKEAPKETKQPTPMETDLTPEQKKAEEEKNKGNDAYKNKKFDLAVEHYTKAHELDPSNIVYLTNRAGTYL
jgi:stress-induced-phosphoprotein 1